MLWDAAFRILINFAVLWFQFLSMKLATVNPLDFSNLPTLLQKDMFQACGPSASSVFSLESSSSGFPFSDQGDVFQSFVPNELENQCGLNPLDLALSQATNVQYAFQDGTASTNLQQRTSGRRISRAFSTSTTGIARRIVSQRRAFTVSKKSHNVSLNPAGFGSDEAAAVPAWRGAEGVEVEARYDTIFIMFLQ